MTVKANPLTNPLTNPLEALQEIADANGTVPYRFALAAAETLHIEYQFDRTYGEEQEWIHEGEALGIDVGEFVAWATSLPELS